MSVAGIGVAGASMGSAEVGWVLEISKANDGEGAMGKGRREILRAGPEGL